MHGSFEGARQFVQYAAGEFDGAGYLREQLGVCIRRSRQAGVLPSPCEADAPEGASTVALGAAGGEGEPISVGTHAAA